MSEIDPVCGMKVSPEDPASVFDGKTYYFCCTACKKSFEANPKKYLSGAKVVSSTGTFTCPMHPEVLKEGSGDCPLCGMALEPLQPGADDVHAENELKDYRLRFWVGLFLGAPLMGLAMAQHPSNIWQRLVQLALSLPIIFYSGKPILVRAWQSIRNRSPNMFTLLGLGAAASLLQGVLSFFLPMPMAYFETAAWILLLGLLGQILETKARGKTGNAIRELLKVSPPTAIKTRPDRKEMVIPTSEIQVGDWIRIPPGSRVPIDGRVIDGKSMIDESTFTGEAIPVEKTPGTHVIAGTLNGTGSLRVRALRVGSDTTLARVIELVAHAQRSQAPIQKLADRVSRFFVPLILSIALLTALGWWIWGPEPKLLNAVINAITVIVIACPCALGLATPMSILVSAGRAARLGVLIKKAEIYEVLERVDLVVFDKTGTLTLGKPVVEKVFYVEGTSEPEFWSLATALETPSEHPLSKAVLNHAALKGIQAKDLPTVSEFEAVTGEGVRARCNNRLAFLGKENFLLAHGISTLGLKTESQSLRAQGFTLIYLAVEGRLLGVMGIRDPLRPEAAEILRALKRKSLELVLLTGDHVEAAQSIVQDLPIDRIEANMTPQQKLKRIQEFQKNGFKVAMVGDGMNDAPALAQADVGFAMGTGTDSALATAAVTLLKSDLRGILTAFELSSKTLRNIRQNLFWAFGYNFLGVPIATGVFYPVTGWLLSPMFATFAMSLSSVFVILNALRLNRYSPSTPH